MNRIFLMTISLVFFSASVYAQYTTTPPPQYQPVIEFEGRYWMPEVDGDVTFSDGGTATDVDLESDLNIDDDDGVPEGRVIWHLDPQNRVRLAYLRMDYEGSNTLSRTIVFDGVTYAGGTAVDSDVELDYLRLGWIVDMAETEMATVGLLLEAKGFLADVELDAPTAGISNSEDFAAAIPSAGLVTELHLLDHLQLFAEASGLPAGKYGHFLDAEAGLKLFFMENVSISGGYRVIDMEFDHDDDEGDLAFAGPFAAVQVRF